MSGALTQSVSVSMQRTKKFGSDRSLIHRAVSVSRYMGVFFLHVVGLLLLLLFDPFGWWPSAAIHEAKKMVALSVGAILLPALADLVLVIASSMGTIIGAIPNQQASTGISFRGSSSFCQYGASMFHAHRGFAIAIWCRLLPSATLDTCRRRLTRLLQATARCGSRAFRMPLRAVLSSDVRPFCTIMFWFFPPSKKPTR